jgi:PmbA protein
MLTKEKTKEICDQIFQLCGKTPAEVIMLTQDHALTRFANNTIHQNVSERNIQLAVRVHQGKSVGMAVTNRIEPASLEEVVENARRNAGAIPEDPEYTGLAEPAPIREVPAFDPDTASFSPEARARQVGIVCREAAQKGLNASGAFSTGTGEFTVANSQGVFAHHAGTESDFQTVVMGEDASGRAHASSWQVADLPVEALGREAINKVELGANPQKIEPGEYTVIADPYVTQDLITMLGVHGMSAQAIQEGRSWMNKRIGQQAMSPLVSIWDDGLDPQGMPLPFDFEGTPKVRVDIVREGVILGGVHNRATAQKEGVKSTGHALPPTAPVFLRAIGPLPINLFMAPGTASLEEMIASTARGLYITRYWYTRLVHPSDCVITGMTRDGVFLVEDGEITQAIKNLRFTQSYVEALAAVEMVGAECRLLRNDYGNIAYAVPALKIKAFNFTGSTV